jgi:hypothetical protein
LIDARFVPIDKWPGQKHAPRNRKKAPFGVTYAKLLDDLERELKHLNARDIIIQAYLTREQIRNDGWPRSSERPSEPGIILSFMNREKEEISFPCDTYVNWDSNLRAVSLTLTALRAIDRCGVTQHAEQYKGWAKLPPAPEKTSIDDAIQFLLLHSGIYPRDSDTLKDAYRAAARKLHPDNAQTGSNGQFVMLERACRALKEAHGW